jgi:serine/threonine protein kinase
LGRRSTLPDADVFALGCVLFRCLAGRLPFEDGDVLSVLLRTVKDEPPSLDELRADVPGELAALVARATAKSPTDRPPEGAPPSPTLHYAAGRRR